MKLPSTLIAPLLVLAVPAQAADDLVSLIDRASAGETILPAELTDALLAQGPEAATSWFRALDLRRPERELLFPEEAPDELATATLLTLEELTSRVPEQVGIRLDDLALTERHAAARVALDVLAVHGTSEDIRLAIDLAVPHPEADYRTHRAVGTDLSAALTAILLRHPGGYDDVERRYGVEHEWLDLHLLRGLGGTRTARALRLLPQLLGTRGELDSSVLLEIGNVARWVDIPLEDSAIQRVRLYLSSQDTEERKQAAVAVGRLDDYDAVEDLIGLLIDTDRGVRTNAYWALREITAMTINAEPRRWRIWFDDETGWWAEEAPDLLMYLKDESPAEVCRAINECGRKRLFRRQLTPSLVPLLRHADSTVVRATCSALFTLRATDATPSMARVLTHDDDEVRRHAWSILRDMTGRQDLPPEYGPWRRALESGLPAAR